MARRGFSLEQSETKVTEVSDRVAKAEADSLEDFRPRQPRPAPVQKMRPAKKDEGWPSREAKPEPAPQKEPTVQLHIHGPKNVADRFDALCKDDRRSRWAMLEILMDSFEKTHG